MLKNVTVVFLLACTVFSGQVWSQETNDCTSAGRAVLFNGTVLGLRSAHEIFSLSLADQDCVDDRELIFLQAMTRIAMWAFADDGLPINSAVEFGIENDVRLINNHYRALDLVAGEVFFPVNEHDSYDMPEDGESVLSDLFEFMTLAGVSEIESVIAELDRIWETPEDRFRMFLTPQETAMFFGSFIPVLSYDIEIDYGEVLLLKGALSATRAFLLSKKAYDLHVVDEETLIEKLVSSSFSINNDLLLPHPDFLKLLPTSNDPNDGAEALLQARAGYIDAINNYLEATAYILSEDDPPGSDPQDDELLFLGSDLTTIEALEVNLRMLLDSLENDETGVYTYETIQSYSLQVDDANAIGAMELVFDALNEGKGGSIDLQYCGYALPEWDISELYIENGQVYADLESRAPDFGPDFPRNLDSANSVLFTPVECAGMIPYNYEVLDTSLFEMTGLAQGWKGSSQSWIYTLPFEFSFYGTSYGSVHISTNGFLDFMESGYYYWNLSGKTRIQPLGASFRTDIPGDYDIYIDAGQDEVEIRWQTDYNRSEINFSATLFRDGRIRFDYGPQGSDFWPRAGISNGSPSAAIIFGSNFYGFFSGTLAEGGGSITEGVLDFWGARSGLIENISADLVDTVTLNQTADINPIFGSSVRYPDPVSPRDLLPEFDEWSTPLPNTMGNGLGQDATLGGILPEMTQDQWRTDLYLEPAANLDWQVVDPGQLVDGWVSSWTVDQLVLNDYEGDIPVEFAGIGGLDVDTLHMGHDPNYLYGSIALYDSMLPNGTYGFGVGLSRDPYDNDALEAVEVCIQIEQGAAQAYVRHNTIGPNGHEEEENIGAVEVVSFGNRLDFRVPFDLMSDYLDGRFVTVTSEWDWTDADVNETHIRMGQVGTVSGTVTYANYNGASIFVQAYLDPGDPEGSVISTTMITEPGPYVLEGIGIGWTGYVRAFTKLFGFDILSIDALTIEESVIAVMSGASAEDVNIVLNDPPVLLPDVPVADQIDTEIDRWDIYAFDALEGADYTLQLTPQTAENARMILLARDGDDELADTGSQPLDWQCERTGTYYVKVEEFSWQPTGGTYQITLAADPVSFADAYLKAAIEQTLGVIDPTPADMLGLTDLEAWEIGITDLTGLEYALNLVDLGLGYNAIADISPLSALTNLQSLFLEGNLIQDISPLSGLENLNYVYLDYNLISDVFPLTKLSQLSELLLHDNPLSQASYCLYMPEIEANNPLESGVVGADPNPYNCESFDLSRRYVDDDAEQGGDGHSWDAAFKYLQDALEAAQPGDEIWIAEGTYKPDQGGGNTPGDRYATFYLMEGVAIYGGFPFGGDKDGRDPDLYRTILSGDLSGNDVLLGDPAELPGDLSRSENSFHVVSAIETDSETVLDGVIVSGGNANGDGEVHADRGGGMYMAYSSAVISDCDFEGNTGDYGGGIYCASSSPTVKDCVFVGNAVSTAGGAMYNVDYAWPEISNCSFVSSRASLGGAMVNYMTASAITDCTFSDNTTYTNPINLGYGGAIYNNEAWPVDISRCKFSGNAGTYGGAIANYLSSVAITSCLLFGNTAYEPTHGGGVCTYYGDAAITNCTFSANTANGGGGAISNLDLNWDPSYFATITNCILWGNTGSVDAPDIHARYSVESVTVSYCDVEEDYPGIGNFALDPLFADGGYWDDNATPGDPNDDFWVEADYHVQSGSPCFNAGDPDYLVPEIRVVIDEQHVFTDPFPVELSEANIDIASIVVTDANGIEIYQEGDDYTVTEVDGNVSLNITPLGVVLPNITNGQQLHVDYTYTFDPAQDATDLDDEPRIVHGRVDMGAYENQYIFVDANLKAAVEAALGVTDPTPEDMLALTSLTAENSGITDLTGLEFATNLTSLNLGENQISDISPLAGSTNMIWLNLSMNQISDISLVAGLTNLDFLALGGNQIADISPVAGLANLTLLFLVMNQISDISPVAGLTNLTSLLLNGNQISNISAVAGLTNLQVLDLGGNQLGDISPLAGLTNLTYLNLSMNQISDISLVAGLTNLTGLALSGNQISDICSLSELTNLQWLYLEDNGIIDLSCLANLTNLEELYLYNNQISDISPLAGLTNLTKVLLQTNQIEDVSALMGLEKLTDLALEGNSLSEPSYCQYLPIIRSNNPDLDLSYDEAGDLPCDVEGRIYVDSNAPLGGDGSTWLQAVKYLQDALTVAEQGNVIWVAEGTYKPDEGGGNTPGDRDATFQLKNGVVIYGGFPIGGDWKGRNPETYETILSGDLAGDDQLVEDPADLPAEPTRIENSLHVVTGSGTDETAVLAGLIIEGGNANEAEGDDNGGGMTNADGSPTVMNCVFRNNSADMAGGGMFNSYSSAPIIQDCVFTYNNAEDAGGAIVNAYDSDPEFIRCIFERNSALQGGAIVNTQNSSPSLTDCTFRENAAAEDAGAIHNDDDSSPLITSCEFIGNRAVDEGGAIQNDSCQPTFINCIFAGNQATYAGAIRNEAENESPCVATFVNCTLTGNRATNDVAISSIDSTVTLRNCILWDDEPSEIDAYNSTLTVTYSNVQGGWTGVENIDADPLFIDPGQWDNNGTPSDLSDDVWVNGDYHLKSQVGRWDPAGQTWQTDLDTSPCIDAGNPAAPVGGEAFPNGGIINMGAYGGTNEASKSIEWLQVIYVDAAAPGNNDGSDWPNAFLSLQDAIEYAVQTNELITWIWVAAGIYTPDQGILQVPGDRTATFQLTPGIGIYGGFAGTEFLLRQRDPIANVTILSGDLNGDDQTDAYDDNSYHIITATSADASAVLDGFVISGGNRSEVDMKGSGLLASAGGATVRNCTFELNYATCAAAIDSRDSEMSFEDIMVRSNASDSDSHTAFSKSNVNIQGLFSMAEGQMDVFAGMFYGTGAIELQQGSSLIINNTDTCSGKIITNIYDAQMDPTTIYSSPSPYGIWPGQWWIPGASLKNVIVAGEDTVWCIAPDFAGESAVLLWQGNELLADLSYAGHAEAVFKAGGELLIYGRLYDGTIEGSNVLFEGLLLWAHVDVFHVRENLIRQNVELTAPVEITPLGGFLVANELGMRLSGKQLLSASFGHCLQNVPATGGTIELRDFKDDIETDSVSVLSMVPADLSKAKTIISTNVIGAGDVKIQSGSELRLADGMLRLQDIAAQQGTIEANGKLIASGNAFVKDSHIQINSAAFVQGSEVHYNDVGGEFFVEGAVSITNNTIEAEGDRYLNLDPAGYGQMTIEDNNITVIIPPEELSEQGTLLELRGRDFDCGTTTNPDCMSGAWQTTIGNRFDNEPADNWVLERLELESNARLNLTNRRGFEFNGAGGREALYVRELVLGPDAVLNTALYTLYYEDLILTDENGDPTTESNGSSIVDIPLLGFSLKIIDMNDPTPSPNNEFDLRVDSRVTDPADRAEVGHGAPLPKGSIVRLEHARDTNDGVMEMATRGPGGTDATSVAAKGAFARAGDEDVTVEFEYLFLEDPHDEAELIVYLSDASEVGGSLMEIARIRPPATDRAGAVGSTKFAIFSGTFARGSLNFTRGTYVELELRGTDTRCWIDNWDPVIRCGVVCGDYGGWLYGVVGIEDYLLLLSEFGLSWPVSVNKGCLDLINDGVINVNDLMAWDIEGMLNVCPAKSGHGLSNKAMTATKAYTGPRIGVYEPLVVSGKPALNADSIDLVPADYLYSTQADGTVIESALADADGKVISDADGRLYQIRGNGALVHQSTGSVVFGPKQDIAYASGTVTVGYTASQGVPILDAAFSRTDPKVIYVLPVLVTPQPGATPYKAAAKLALSGNLNDPNYSIAMIYGMDPNTDPTVTVKSESDGTILFEPDVQQLSEIEVDSDGNLYILSAHGYTDNKWVLMYDEQIGNPSETRVSLGQFNIANPAVMLASDYEKLYLTSCANESADLATEVYRFSIVRQGGNDPNLELDETITVNCPDPNICDASPALCAGGSYVTTITAMAEDPDDGTVYATGFTAPMLDPNLAELPPEIEQRGIYTTAMLAEIPFDTAGPVDAKEFNDATGAPIVLPMSIAWTGGALPKCGGADISGNGNVDMEDFAIMVSQWLSTSPGLSADIAPERYYDETVDNLDLAALATYWLQTGCN